MPLPPSKFDAMIIGSGQGGNPLASAIAKRGDRVAVIESGHLGGTCINTGCTPTKTMIASAQVAYYARNADRWGVKTSDVDVDLPAVLRRKNEIVLRFRHGWEKSFEADNRIRVYRGRATFSGSKIVEVNGETLTAERIFIDTGSAPSIPAIDGLNSVPYLTNESLLELERIPAHLLVLGGGYVGLEFGQMFRRFGSEVTVIQSNPRILPREDEDVTSELQRCLEAEGIRFVLGSRAKQIRGNGDAISVRTEGQNGSEILQGSHLLVATGRTPQTKDLQLEKTGVETDARGFIRVNDRLEASAPGIWAIGDVTGGPAFTHISYNDFQIIYGNVYEGQNLSTSKRIVPYAVYTDPTLGRVGLTEKDARAEGKKLKIGRVDMSRVPRAAERAETSGFMKLVVDAESDLILGASILSVEGGELVQILSTLMLAQKPYTLLKGAIYIHPTLAEGFFGLMDSVK